MRHCFLYDILLIKHKFLSLKWYWLYDISTKAWYETNKPCRSDVKIVRISGGGSLGRLKSGFIFWLAWANISGEFNSLSFLLLVEAQETVLLLCPCLISDFLLFVFLLFFFSHFICARGIRKNRKRFLWMSITLEIPKRLFIASFWEKTYTPTNHLAILEPKILY